jgi:transglutaminase-like putative cysteine protease
MRAEDGWRLRIEHVTTFLYSTPARASYNEVRQTPLTTGRQTTLESGIRTAPHALQNSYWDYWGTQVVSFNVDAPHDELTIRGRALVETKVAEEPATATWDEVGGRSDRLSEYLAPSRYTEATPHLVEVAAGLRRDTPQDTVRAVADWVHGSLEYMSGVTSVRTSAVEAFEAGRGVCQDFAHLAIAMLRLTGVPTRYVSGYLHPKPDAEIGNEVKGESHAWIESWLGQWWGLDPTNATEIGERHVAVARGRDYADVAPVKGVFAGRADHSTKVSVSITRVA